MTEHQIREYCEAELENLNAVARELYMVVKPDKIDYTTAEMAAIATFLHNFYNGAENILKRISRASKVEHWGGSSWHKELLKSACERGIITKELYGRLFPYLSFRHFFIHSYSFKLRWMELKPLVENFHEAWKMFKTEILSYIESLC